MKKTKKEKGKKNKTTDKSSMQGTPEKIIKYKTKPENIFVSIMFGLIVGILFGLCVFEHDSALIDIRALDDACAKLTGEPSAKFVDEVGGQRNFKCMYQKEIGQDLGKRTIIDTYSAHRDNLDTCAGEK